MGKEKLIDIFKIDTAKSLNICENFREFLEKNSIREIDCQIFELPWAEYQKFLSAQIVTAINKFKNTQSVNKNNKIYIPKEGLKGVYFCVGDDAFSLGIFGSLYYNEEDWAANAEFDQKIDGKIIVEITNKLKLLGLEKESIPDVRCCFLVYTVNKTIRQMENIDTIKNASVVFGYSDNNELILGYFKNGKFVKDIKFGGYGEYENKSSAPEYEVDIVPRGEIWYYISHNYRRFMRDQDLLQRFEGGGEMEAEKIRHEFKDYILINRCSKCGAVKKTPRARLCVTCGNFDHGEL
jgi:hypothetical protein